MANAFALVSGTEPDFEVNRGSPALLEQLEAGQLDPQAAVAQLRAARSS